MPDTNVLEQINEVFENMNFDNEYDTSHFIVRCCCDC